MEYPIINVDAENEHFEMSDSIISWMESCKASNSKSTKTTDLLNDILPPPSTHHQLSAPGMAWSLVRIFCEKQGRPMEEFLPNLILNDEKNNLHDQQNIEKNLLPPVNQSSSTESLTITIERSNTSLTNLPITTSNQEVRMRGNDEWAPPRAQIIFNIHEESNFRKAMQRQNYLCAGCGTKIDLELARRLVLFCHYLGKYFCKCCFSHKAIHLPGYILQKWDFHKYPVSHFALQLLDKIANEPLFNINDINSGLYRRVRKLKHLIDIRMQLYYLKIYISTCTQTDKLNGEYNSFSHQHLLQDDVHQYSLNNLIEIQHGKLYEYLNDLVVRSIAHIAQCDRCRAKGHYCQLCGPSSLMSSMISSGSGSTNQGPSDQVSINYQKLKQSNNIGQSVLNAPSSPTLLTPIPINTTTTINANDHQLIFPFEIGRVAQCRGCGCCFHLQCFMDADQNCPKCERIQRRKAEMVMTTANTVVGTSNGTVGTL